MTIDRRWCGALPLIMVLGCGGEGTGASASTSGGGGSGATSTSAGSGGAASSTSSTGEGGATSSSTSSTTTGSGGTGGGGSAPTVPTCYTTCNTASDCAAPGAPLLDLDNWACTAGKCDYQGCNSTKECTDTYMKPNYVCASVPGSPTKACYNTCSTAADCAAPGAPLLDLDNWACTAGKCDYQGCNSTKECTDTYMKPNYVCAPIPGYPTKACYNTCNTASDCAAPGAPLLDLDNWACTAGKCDYQGCNSTKECTDTYMKPGYVCE